MHGLILSELKKYVDTKLGGDAWRQLLAATGLENKVYLVSGTYPDADVVALVSAAERITGLSTPTLLESFGEFIVPDLVEVYRPLIRPTWSALDLIEHTEETIHRAVRLRQPGAEPPQLRATRVSEREVRIAYTSARRMCTVAKGIVKGVGTYYKQPLEVTESSCMLRGDAACTLHVRSA